MVITSSVQVLARHLIRYASHESIPCPLAWPNKFDENKDRRGVANVGLNIGLASLVRLLCAASAEDKGMANDAPLINMEILRQISSQTGCW